MSSRIVAERIVVAAVSAALVVAATPARAQPASPAPSPRSAAPPQDAAVAQSLFDEARRLMIANRFAEACPKLAESERLDPALGTLLNLAVCNERLGKTASAWGEYRDAESVAKREGRSERAAYAHERAAAIEPRLSRLVIARRRDDADRGLEVRLDGHLVGEAAFGSAVPIDPGSHVVEARATGKKPRSTSVTISPDASTSAIEIASLEDAPLPPPPVAQGMAQGGPLAITMPSAPPQEDARPSSGGLSRRTVSYVIGGVGVTALAFGAVAGMQALVKWDDRKTLCTGDSCPQSGVSADSSARGWALASDVGLGVGVVAAGTAAYLFFTSRGSGAPEHIGAKGVHVVPMAVARGAGVGLGGAW